MRDSVTKIITSAKKSFLFILLPMLIMSLVGLDLYLVILVLINVHKIYREHDNQSESTGGVGKTRYF